MLAPVSAADMAVIAAAFKNNDWHRNLHTLLILLLSSVFLAEEFCVVYSMNLNENQLEEVTLSICGI